MSDNVETSIVQTLQSAVEGLLFPSETDAPLVPFFWPDEDKRKLTPALLREFAEIPADAKIKSVKLERFFQPATTEKDWHNDEEQAEVKRFQELVETLLSTLHKPKVFRVDKTSVDCYIVGKVEGGWAGFKTHIVET